MQVHNYQNACYTLIKKKLSRGMRNPALLIAKSNAQIIIIIIFFFFFFIQFKVPFKIISLIETSQSVGEAKREYPGKTT